MLLSLRKTLCSISAIVTLLTCTPGIAKVEHYEGKQIESVEIIPKNISSKTSFDPQIIRQNIQSKIGTSFSQDTFDQDLKFLSHEFERIEPKIDLDQGEVDITLEVWLKPDIRNIVFKGNKIYKSDKLRKELDIKPLTTFDREKFISSFNKLQQYYVKHGYFEAELNYKIEPVEGNNEIDIIIDIQEGRSGKVKAIEFHGVTKDEESDLLDDIRTKKYNMFTGWATGAGIYHEELIEHDKLSIIDYLQNKGYAEAKVDIKLSEVPQSKKVIIDIDVDKGDEYIFGKLTFSGHQKFSKDKISPLFAMKKGAPYSPNKIRTTIGNISDFYGRHGYIDATIIPQARLDEEKDIYNVNFEIDEGQQYRVGMIRVYGNEKTNIPVILHETHLIPGDVFNTIKLEKTEERLRNMGYFKNVHVYAARTDKNSPLTDNFRDVIIEVEETSTGNIGFSFGFSTSEKLFGGIDLVERNFNIEGIPKVFDEGFKALRGGGEYAHLKCNVGSKQRSWMGSWTKPYFMNTQWTVGFDAEYLNNRALSDDYDINSWNFALRGFYSLNQFMNFGCHYRLRTSDINVTTDDISQLLRDEARNSGITSAVGCSLNYDSTNSPVMPSRGFRSSLETEIAGLGGDYNFINFEYLNTYYYPIFDFGILKYRLDLKFKIPFGDTHATDLPLDERFTLGGETTVRGFRFGAIGPTYNNGEARGGITSGLFSVEYLHHLHKKVDLFAFMDSGQLSLKEFDFDNYLYTSVGYGCRLQLLNGIPPVAIGMGYPLNAKNPSQVRRFFLSFGTKF
ncbi:MAG: outer membrane protein assembly factor BamA [Chlamydiota bacterium]